MRNKQEADDYFEKNNISPNKTTIAAILEGKIIAYDNIVAGYNNIEDLKAKLDT